MDYIERDTALIVFSFLLVLYVVWIDARPFVFRWIASKKKLSKETQIGDYILEKSVFKPQLELGQISIQVTPEMIERVRNAVIEELMDYFSDSRVTGIYFPEYRAREVAGGIIRRLYSQDGR